MGRYNWVGSNVHYSETFKFLKVFLTDTQKLKIHTLWWDSGLSGRNGFVGDRVYVPNSGDVTDDGSCMGD